MVEVKGTTIEMTRGDTLDVKVNIMQGSSPYEIQSGDSVRFALKSAKMNSKRTEYVDEEPLLVVNIPVDTLILRIESEATKPFGFGDYVYDIQMTFADGRVDTFITNAKFVLLPEVD